jgi:hypothetical protein
MSSGMRGVESLARLLVAGVTVRSSGGAGEALCAGSYRAPPPTPAAGMRSAQLERTRPMSPQMIRIIVGVVLLGHGLGHALTALPLFGVRLSGFHSTESWLLGRVLEGGIASGICAVLNPVALLGFVVAGLGLAGWGVPRELWGRLAVLAALVSSLALLLFWNAFPFLFPNKIGVMVVNVWAVGSVLWFRWPLGLFDG